MSLLSRRLRGALAALVVLATPAPHAQAGEPDDMAGIVAAHNTWRKIVNVPPLGWSESAAQMAQTWANQLAAEGCAARYNPDPMRKERYGENVMKAFGGEPYKGWKRTPQEVVDRWGEEGRFYDLATNTCNAPAGRICGHYTQLTWATTEAVGCGHARCDKAEVWVCDYTPRGNLVGHRPYGESRRTAQAPVDERPPVLIESAPPEPLP
jgi:hypothetical protein